MGLAVFGVLWLDGTEPRPIAGDIETVRAEFRAQVANGELSEAEAQVRFAEAYARSKKGERKRGEPQATEQRRQESQGLAELFPPVFVPFSASAR